MESNPRSVVDISPCASFGEGDRRVDIIKGGDATARRYPFTDGHTFLHVRADHDKIGIADIRSETFHEFAVV